MSDIIQNVEEQEEKAPVVRKDFDIPEENLRELEEKISKLNRKARKLKLPEIVLTKGETFSRLTSVCVGFETRMYQGYEVECPVMKDIMVKFVPVNIEGARPQIAGYTFIATVDHLPTGTNVFRNVEGFKVDERFRNAGTVCEHCNKFRTRKDTYIVQNESGAQKQIGRNCLKDFLGGKSPLAMAAMAELLMDAMSAGDSYREIGGSDGGMRKDYAIDLADCLAWANLSIRLNGWVSGKTAYENHITSTAAHSSGMRIAAKETSYNGPRPEEKDTRIAGETIAWVRGLSDEECAGNEYLTNLRATMKGMDYIQYRAAGLCVSAIPSYHRHLEKVMEAKQFVSQKNSKYVGAIGDRMVFSVTVLKLISYHSEMYGGGVIYRMITDEGNVITAFSLNQKNFSVEESNDKGEKFNRTDVQAGDKILVKGTIKKHQEYKEIQQTVISRATVHIEKPKKPRKKKEQANEEVVQES